MWTWVAQSPRETLSLTPFTFYPGYEQNPAISPDGRQIAYVGQGVHGTNPLELYVQAIGSTDPVRLTHNRPGEENHSPAWDPTGATLAVLRTVGGTPVRPDSPRIPHGAERVPTWASTAYSRLGV